MLQAGAVIAVGCAQEARDTPRPDAVLAESLGAQAAFRRIEERWYDRPDSRVVQRRSLERFIQRFPQDELVRRALVYLAWIRVQQGELKQARALAARTRSGALGAVRDLADVIEASIRVRLGQPQAALALLLPLEGKLIDAGERAFYREQLITARLKAKDWQGAVDSMLRWAADTELDQLELVHSLIGRMIEDIPPAELERSLGALGDDQVSAEMLRERAWLRGVLVERLTAWAVARRDAELARRLLGERPTSKRQVADRVELARLAASGGSAPSVHGRALGLVLSTGSPQRLRRSAELASGVTRALGLPESGRDPTRVQLASAQEDGAPGGMRRALRELAGAGAAVILAGVDEQSSAEAAVFAASSGVSVILVEPPEAHGSDAFVIGVERALAMAVLHQAAAQRGLRWATVTPAQCAASPPRAGGYRFLVGKWRADGVEALALEGSSRCAGDLGQEAKRAGIKPWLLLGLDAADAYLEPLSGARRLSVASASWPLRRSASGALVPREMRAFHAQRGVAPSWYAALGFDAARLARAALEGLPLSDTRDDAQVAKLHATARRLLLEARAALWTSEARGFDAEGRIPRQLGVLGGDAPGSAAIGAAR